MTSQIVQESFEKVKLHPVPVGGKESLLKQCLTEEVYNQCKDVTIGDITLSDVIRSGVENPDSGVGIYAPCGEAYEKFAPLLDSVIEKYHGFDVKQQQSALDFGDVNHFTDLDPEGKFIVSTRIRCARNIKGYPMHGKTSKAQYEGLESDVVSALSTLEGDLTGQYYPLAGMTEETRQQLVQDHFLFKQGDRYLESAGANAHWPAGRGIYHNAEKTFLVWVNEEDHLRIISMQMGADFKTVYQRWMTALQNIDKVVPFDRHDRLGYVTFCPSNLGTAVRASVHIKLPNLSRDTAAFEKITSELGLQVRGTDGEHSESKSGIFDVSNKRRLGLSEFEAVAVCYNGVKKLIELETDLAAEVETQA